MAPAATEPVSFLASASLVSSQAAAEYLAVTTQSAAARAQMLVGQASNWILDHPAVAWGVAGFFLLLLWGTRSRAR